MRSGPADRPIDNRLINRYFFGRRAAACARELPRFSLHREIEKQLD